MGNYYILLIGVILKSFAENAKLIQARWNTMRSICKGLIVFEVCSRGFSLPNDTEVWSTAKVTFAWFLERTLAAFRYIFERIMSLSNAFLFDGRTGNAVSGLIFSKGHNTRVWGDDGRKLHRHILRPWEQSVLSWERTMNTREQWRI